MGTLCYYSYDYCLIHVTIQMTLNVSTIQSEVCMFHSIVRGKNEFKNYEDYSKSTLDEYALLHMYIMSSLVGGNLDEDLSSLVGGN